MGPTAKDTNTLYTLQFSHLVLDALTHSCPTTKWEKNLYGTVIWSVYDSTLISGNEDKRGYFFFLFFSFFFSFFTECAVFSCSYLSELINPFFSFKNSLVST